MIPRREPEAVTAFLSATLSLLAAMLALVLVVMLTAMAATCTVTPCGWDVWGRLGVGR